MSPKKTVNKGFVTQCNGKHFVKVEPENNVKNHFKTTAIPGLATSKLTLYHYFPVSKLSVDMKNLPCTSFTAGVDQKPAIRLDPSGVIFYITCPN